MDGYLVGGISQGGLGPQAKVIIMLRVMKLHLAGETAIAMSRRTWNFVKNFNDV